MQTVTAPSSSQPTAMNITREDIELLVREPSAAMRSRIAQKISAGYSHHHFSPSEIALANEIFRLLLKDTEMRVRKQMAEELKSCADLPHDIAWKLANDHHEVAAPILQYSPILTEEDLIQIVEATREHPKLRAIAQRDTLSKHLAHALVASEDAKIIKLVVGNQGAVLDDEALGIVLRQFGRDQSILEEMVYRGGLPIQFAEALFTRVSDNLKKQLTKKYRLSRHVLEDAGNNARETATLQFLSPFSSQQDITQLVDQMHRNGRLTDSVIIRSLCIGDLRFFEGAIAKRVGIPPSNARILILDPGPLGFKALYHSAQLPDSFYKAIAIMLQFALQETEYGTYRNADFSKRMSEHIHRGGFDKSIENMDVLLRMIGHAYQSRIVLH